MIGTIANVSAILAGSIIGSALKKGIGEKYQSILMDAMGLAATVLGINAIISAMPESKYHVLFIVSLALGGRGFLDFGRSFPEKSKFVKKL